MKEPRDPFERVARLADDFWAHATDNVNVGMADHECYGIGKWIITSHRRELRQPLGKLAVDAVEESVARVAWKL